MMVMGGLTGAAERTSAADAESSQLQDPTHRQIRIITPKVDGQSVRLYTIATTPDGNIVAGVEAGSSGRVLLINSEGETLRQWSLELIPTGIAVSPDGTIYAGGSGRIAQLGADGSVVKVIDSPHVGDVEELKKKTAESIRRSREQMSASFGRQIELLKERVAKIEEKDEEDRSKLEQAQWKAFTTQLETLEKLSAPEAEDGGAADSHLSAAVLRTMNVTSMAASDEDLFICATDPSQGGYSVWRIDRDLDSDSSEVIMDGLRGCCGQMDIQCCNGQLVVSENTRFKIGIYDRHGRAQQSFGRRDRTSREGFGSCCNPMNSLPMADGTILTAESSIGHIKRFDADGKLVAYIGKAGIGGGCKHCALGYDEKNDLYYMMYQDKNAICVLANNDKTPMTLAEKELQQQQIDFLARAAGKWDMDGKKKSASSGGLLSLFGGGRGGSSQHPITSLKVGSDGSAKILDGMYKAYGDQATLELLPRTDDSDTIPFALAIDQVRFLEGTWTFDGDDSAKLDFQGMSSLTMKRDASAETCAGADCDNPDCKDENCPNHGAKPQEASVAVAAVVSENEMDEIPFLSELSDVDASYNLDLSSQYLTPAIEYKVIAKKELGENPEATLNQIGADGWDYCGRIGKKLMFKRVTFNTSPLTAMMEDIDE